MTTPSGYDKRGKYLGPCPDCGTDHDGAPGPETVSGKFACLHAQALGLGATDFADHIAIGRDWAYLAQANALGLPSDVDKPKWADLFGIDPDFTEGQPVDEWLDEQRGEA